jgi:hypothetical protein
MKFFLLSLFLLASIAFKADEYRLINSIPFQNASFTTDNFGNAYVITENQLFQFDTLGKLKANYSERNAGNLHSIDVSNPLKMLLFYPDFAQLQILDSKLALQSTINLRDLNIIQPVAACQSLQGGYWIFDLQDYQLMKMDLNLQLKVESGNVTQTLGYSPVPNFVLEHDNNIYLNNPSTGILVFDLYAAYIKTIPIDSLKSFQIIGNELLFVKDNTLMKHNLKTLEQSQVFLPSHDSLISSRIEQQQLYLLTTSSLNFYSY